MATTLGPRTRASLRLLGWAGLIICAILALGIIGGRIWVGNALGGIFVTADTAIGDGLTSFDDATARLSDGAASLDASRPLLQRWHAERNPSHEEIASLRKICPPGEESPERDVDIAARLLRDPALYAAAVRTGSIDQASAR